MATRLRMLLRARTTGVALVLTACSFIGHGAARAEPQAAAAPATTEAARPASPVLSDAEIERFLRTARIVRVRPAGKGVTASLRATLSDGTLTHDAHIQTVNVHELVYRTPRGTERNFRDSWRYNVAAYRLDRLLGLGMVPVSVVRSYQGNEGAFTWWVDDVMMDEGGRLKQEATAPDLRRWSEQVWAMRVFDQLIDNTDRNHGNQLITHDWRLWLIDHTRAFRWTKTLRTPQFLTHCDGRLLEQMRALDRETLRREMGRMLSRDEIDALLARRDLIVAHFDQLGTAAIYATATRTP